MEDKSTVELILEFKKKSPFYFFLFFVGIGLFFFKDVITKYVDDIILNKCNNQINKEWKELVSNDMNNPILIHKLVSEIEQCSHVRNDTIFLKSVKLGIVKQIDIKMKDNYQVHKTDILILLKTWEKLCNTANNICSKEEISEIKNLKNLLDEK